jgi:hypothetical protein
LRADVGPEASLPLLEQAIPPITSRHVATIPVVLLSMSCPRSNVCRALRPPPP